VTNYREFTMSSPHQPPPPYHPSSNWHPPAQPGHDQPAPAGVDVDVLVVKEPRRRLSRNWVIPSVAVVVLLVFVAGWIGGTAYTKHEATSPDSDALKVPQAVRSHMEQTRALDGRQTDTWPGFTASWTYHPEQGLDVVVQVA
jgi:hypothetical protein